MNPAAPRDPVVTRVLLSIAGALFLLNLCVLIAGFTVDSRQMTPTADSPPVHRCFDTHVVVAPELDFTDDLTADLADFRARLQELRIRVDEVRPEVWVEVQTSTVVESL
ncbi:MAG: hypothetical protein R3178_05565 [Rhodothermales bacterium]|nr:hypothetical protein [Rhodothermales bacterium]